MEGGVRFVHQEDWKLGYGSVHLPGTRCTRAKLKGNRCPGHTLFAFLFFGSLRSHMGRMNSPTTARHGARKLLMWPARIRSSDLVNQSVGVNRPVLPVSGSSFRDEISVTRHDILEQHDSAAKCGVRRGFYGL